MVNIDDLKLGIVQINNSNSDLWTISLFSGDNYQ